MKKQVMKLLRMAQKELDYEARDVLHYIKNTNMMKKPMKCEGSCYEWTYFSWDILKVHYNGITEEIVVYWGKNSWTLCD